MSTNYFDERAAAWDDNPMRVKLSQAIAAFICRKVPLNNNFSVLDYGCGTGLLSFQLSDKAACVCAADISEGMLTEVCKKIKANNVKNIEAVNLDITKDKPINKKFDLIVSAMAMHHIDDMPETIRRLAGLLKTNGWLAIADLCVEDGSFHDAGAVVHNGFDADEMKICFEKNGIGSAVWQNVFEIEKNNRKYPVFCIIGKKTL